MATTTTNFGWDIPQSTDLVKDGATAIAALGQDIDTALVDLKGGTTGQILSKASNTDLDYSWITNDVGDITAVTAGTGISGGGTSGAVTVTNSMATAITTAGDVIYGTGSGTFTRLGIGTAGQVLQVNGGATAPAWATAASSAMVYVGGTTFSASSAVNVNNVFSATYANYTVVADYVGSAATAGMTLRFRVSGADNTTANYNTQTLYGSGTTAAAIRATGQTSMNFTDSSTGGNFSTVNVINPFATAKSLVGGYGLYNSDAGVEVQHKMGVFTSTTSFTGFSLIPSSGTITGTVRVYGLVNS